MRKGIWGLIVWLQVLAASVAANPTAEWNQGEVFLQNGTQLHGALNFNWAAQVVQYRQGVCIKAYSASQVRSFTYFDRQQDALRKFACLTQWDKAGHPRLFLLEEIVGGSVTVYRQVRYPHGLFHVAQLSSLIPYGELCQSIDNFSYWVVSRDTLVELSEFYRQAWPQVSRPYQTELAQTSSRMGWSTRTTTGRLQQISVYNALAKQALPPLQPVAAGN